MEETTVIKNYYEVINSDQLNQLIILQQDSNDKFDLLNTNFSTLIKILQNNLNYVMLIFFVLSIVGGLYIGYILGRKK